MPRWPPPLLLSFCISKARSGAGASCAARSVNVGEARFSLITPRPLVRQPTRSTDCKQTGGCWWDQGPSTTQTNLCCQRCGREGSAAAAGRVRHLLRGARLAEGSNPHRRSRQERRCIPPALLKQQPQTICRGVALTYGCRRLPEGFGQSVDAACSSNRCKRGW